MTPNLQTEHNLIIQELMSIATRPEHIDFLIKLSTDVSIDLLNRNERLKTEVMVLKTQRDWMLNKILERVNKN